MKITNTYSFKKGEAFIKKNHPKELRDILNAIKKLDAVSCLTKESREKTMKGRLLFSPLDMNDNLKLRLHNKGWTEKAEGKKKKFKEPRHAFGKIDSRNGWYKEQSRIRDTVWKICFYGL